MPPKLPPVTNARLPAAAPREVEGFTSPARGGLRGLPFERSAHRPLPWGRNQPPSWTNARGR